MQPSVLMTMNIVIAAAQVVPLILSVMDGYPSLLLAYGELASGQATLVTVLTIITAPSLLLSQVKAPLCSAHKEAQA